LDAGHIGGRPGPSFGCTAVAPAPCGQRERSFPKPFVAHNPATTAVTATAIATVSRALCRKRAMPEISGLCPGYVRGNYVVMRSSLPDTARPLEQWHSMSRHLGRVPE